MYDLPVREFKYRKGHIAPGDEREEKHMPGFIAEEVDELFPIAAIHDEEGRPTDWDARVIVPMMLKLIQDQHKEIEAIKAKVS